MRDQVGSLLALMIMIFCNFFHRYGEKLPAVALEKVLLSERYVEKQGVFLLV